MFRIRDPEVTKILSCEDKHVFIFIFTNSQTRAPVKTMKISSKRVSTFLLISHISPVQPVSLQPH